MTDLSSDPLARRLRTLQPSMDTNALARHVLAARTPGPRLVAPRAVGRTRHWPRTALVATLAIFALVGATVALPLLQSLWSQDRGLQYVTGAGLARDLDLTETIGGVTVHVQKGYADANRVAIGYGIELPPTTADGGAQVSAPIMTLSAPILTDDNGNTYPDLGFTTTNDSPLGAQLHNFKPVGATGGRDVAFTLTIPEVDRTPQGSGTVQVYRGPWVFKFTLPMAAARVVEPALTFTRPGMELTFTRIVVAPSATRLDYRVHLEGFTDRAGVSLMFFSTLDEASVAEVRLAVRSVSRTQSAPRS